MSYARRAGAAALALGLGLGAAAGAAASTTHYYYDPLGRFVGETTTGAVLRANSYDPADNRTGFLAWSVAQPSSSQQLLAGQVVLRGQGMASADGVYTLTLQEDGDLVLYHGPTPIWRTSTYASASASLYMGAEGALYLQDAQWSTLWSTGTAGHPGAYLVLQTDGNLVVYSQSGQVLWTSGTSGR